MGQTLENGVYLPSEGERNCYAGLKTNWEILDQKVADVTALQQAVAGALHREIVESLPTTDIDPNTIYMILSGTSATENLYNEFMYVNNAWELIGTSATDLTNYYTKAEVDGKLLLKANASDLTSHTGDTTIHVTTADKNKWNNNTYVFRYSSTALTPSSTNSNTLLDNTDNLKVGDKVIDSNGVLFSITAIDTANSTFTVGSALIDLANDSDVVHTRGNETVGGVKTFINDVTVNNSSASVQTDVPNLVFKNPLVERASTTLEGEQTILFTDKNAKNIGLIKSKTSTSGGTSDLILISYSETSDQSEKTTGVVIRRTPTTSKFIPYSDNITTLGETNRRWSKVYAMNYYYGNDNIEFSNKFVTTDTNQTITGSKTFSSNVNVYNSDTTASTPNFTLRSSKSAMGTSDTDNQGIFLNDKNNDTLASLRILNYTLNGSTYLTQTVNTKDTNNQNISASLSFYILNNGRKVFRPDIDNDVLLGYSSNKWKDVNTYLVNGLTPSSLSLPVAPSSTSYIDISSYITVLDNSAPNKYTPPSNGYITFHVKGSQVQCMHNYGLQAKWSVSSGSVNRGFIPVLGGVEIDIYVSATDIYKFWFIPCQGNV